MYSLPSFNELTTSMKPKKGACSSQVDIRNICIIFVGRPGGKGPIRIPRIRSVGNPDVFFGTVQRIGIV